MFPVFIGVVQGGEQAAGNQAEEVALSLKSSISKVCNKGTSVNFGDRLPNNYVIVLEGSMLELRKSRSQKQTWELACSINKKKNLDGRLNIGISPTSGGFSVEGEND